jgi:hypothetical protein
VSASAAVWWIWGILAFASGIAFCHAARSFHRAARQPAGPIRATGQGDSLDALVAEQQARERLRSRKYNRDDEERLAAEERLSHQNLAWPPNTQPPARTHAATDWALWAEEMQQR